MTIKPRRLPYHPSSPFSLASAFKHRPHRPVVTILGAIFLVLCIVIGISKPDSLTFSDLLLSEFSIVFTISFSILYVVMDLLYRLRKGQIVSAYFNDDYESVRLSLTDGKGGYIDEAIPYEDLSLQSSHFPARFILRDRSIWIFEREGKKVGMVDTAFVSWQGEFYLLRKLNRKLSKLSDTQDEEDYSHLFPKTKLQQPTFRQKVPI